MGDTGYGGFARSFRKGESVAFSIGGKEIGKLIVKRVGAKPTLAFSFITAVRIDRPAKESECIAETKATETQSTRSTASCGDSVARASRSSCSRSALQSGGCREILD